MDKHVLGVYLSELESQSLMALNAINVLDKVTAIDHEQMIDMGSEQRIEINKECFRSVHSFLTHLSNISRLIWPPALSPKQNCFCDKPRAMGLKCNTCVARMRSAEILSALNIIDPEHVLKNRTLRDHLEHFDERIDHWMQTSERRNYVQDYIGAKGGIQGMEESDMMRQYDPDNGNFTFRGETHSLVDLFAGLQDLLGRTRDAISKSRAF
ncbi:hypothetical protein [Pseudomonas sp. Leaf59]|uniref:hypothetical protein n=1 Tax=Pseudomonas sp. Leaf59 TaxID=2876556 RepID=UPI001E3E63C3|nr:hypothetical protein [Pseudomonas sp. Leaf59]